MQIVFFASRAEDLTDVEETFKNELVQITQTVKKLCLNIMEELFWELLFFFFFNVLFLLHIWHPQNIRTTDNIYVLIGDCVMLFEHVFCMFFYAFCRLMLYHECFSSVLLTKTKTLKKTRFFMLCLGCLSISISH